jgi:hypothetical protein
MIWPTDEQERHQSESQGASVLQEAPHLRQLFSAPALDFGSVLGRRKSRKREFDCGSKSCSDCGSLNQELELHLRNAMSIRLLV